MSGSTTRTKIMEVSIRLFNQHGIQHVRLQQIADEAGMSVGNLAYHFHDKKEILKRINRAVEEELATTFKTWKDLKHFIDFDNQLSRLYHFLNTYSFYFLDVVDLKRLYPDLYEGRQEQIEQFIKNLSLWLEVSVERELFAVPKRGGQYGDVSKTIWFITAFWMSKKRILDEEENYELGFKEMIWQQLEPFFAPKGKTEFEIVIAPGLFN
jgi:AcrR family transcriptional regulator